MKATIYLIPTTLGDTGRLDKVFPAYNLEKIYQLTIFVVEKVRTARRFLKAVGHPVPIDEMQFFELNKHTKPGDIAQYLKAAEQGRSMGIISEAGAPAVADPGAAIVRMAHEKGLAVVPLVGPNSILLALMASGFNGQQFAFHGYLPVDNGERIKKIKQLEQEAYRREVTQIFMETPFRNNKMMESLLKVLQPNTLLCVAANLTLPDEYIATRKISQWKKEKADFNKKPAIFLIYK
jgi:16S rRNA (cytidine1402-2'-O)-methyltransferase